jgi:hypothetical protein
MEKVQFETGRQLITAAFDAARHSGRTDWECMTLAVLKNRILDATDREFDQQSWGASTFRDFVELFPDVVRIDRTTAVPIAELLPSTSSGAESQLARPLAHAPGVRSRPWLIRADLWHASLDYSSGYLYVWENATAVRISAVDYDGTKSLPLLPTISLDEMRIWRLEFAVRSISTLDSPEYVEAIERWRDESLTGKALPARVRGNWAETLKSLVRDRLQNWFSENRIPIPDDLIERPQRIAGSRDDTERLRSLIVRCVQKMTRLELEELRLPAAVVLREQT